MASESTQTIKLCEHPDFDQAVLAAAKHFEARGLRPDVIEKDYYVTEVLRMVAATAGDKAIFKGGTSLSKGWSLIERFSEDVDLFLDPLTFVPPLGKNGIDRELKRLKDDVAKHHALTFLPKDSKTIGGFGRMDRFAYTQRFSGAGAVAPRVLLEAGIASGREPTETVSLRSYISEFLVASGRSLGADDEQPFAMRLLHFRRTFVEKLFAIHGKIVILRRDGKPLGPYARHYYDLFQLAGTDQVRAMLHTSEFADIKTDYDRISREHFPRDYHPPEGMRFSGSEALFPTPDFEETLKDEYEKQCKALCYGAYPSWAEVRARFTEIRELL